MPSSNLRSLLTQGYRGARSTRCRQSRQISSSTNESTIDAWVKLRSVLGFSVGFTIAYRLFGYSTSIIEEARTESLREYEEAYEKSEKWWSDLVAQKR